MMKNYFFALLFSISLSLTAQINYSGNGNTGFGGPVGQSSLSIDDDGTTITFTLTKGGGDFNDALVLYLDTGATGRNVIDSEVNDNNDPLRVAISNGDSSGTASDVTFASGFETFYAIGISSDFIGLFSIPPTGPVGANGLGFEKTLVGFPAFNTTDPIITFTLDWSDIGLTNTDSFDFVGLYLSGTAFNSDEAYGDGIAPGATGGTNVAFSNFLTYSQSLGLESTSFEDVKIMSKNKTISIFGIDDRASVALFNILGQSVFSVENIDLFDGKTFQFNELKSGIYLLRLNVYGETKTFKVLLD